MISVIVEKKDPRMEAQKFLEYVGSKDLTKMDKAIADELSSIVKQVKENMDKPDMIMPLIMKGKMIFQKAEMAMEKEGEDMSEDEGKDDMSEMAPEKPEEKSPMDYKAMDAINEIKAILAKVKED
jgi:hypothetical protein